VWLLFVCKSVFGKKFQNDFVGQAFIAKNYLIFAFLKLALDGGEWSASCPGWFTPMERASSTHWIGGWVGPRVSLDMVVKRKIPSQCQDSNPLIIQPVAQCYTTEISWLH
jgi:hypothetical protein